MTWKTRYAQVRSMTILTGYKGYYSTAGKLVMVSQDRDRYMVGQAPRY